MGQRIILGKSLFPLQEDLKLKNEKGFTIIEVLTSLGILAFVIVSILSGFSYRMLSDKNSGNKNIAVVLAEAKLEEYMKFPADKMPQNRVEYIRFNGGTPIPPSLSDPRSPGQFRRTVQVTSAGANLMQISVTVQYGYMGGKYPFSISLISSKGMQ